MTTWGQETRQRYGDSVFNSLYGLRVMSIRERSTSKPPSWSILAPDRRVKNRK
jgi:hypothetical protein